MLRDVMHRFLAVAMWLLVSGGAMMAAPSVEQSGGVVRGSVYALQDESLLPGVVVTLERVGGTQRYETTTDERGQFEIRDIAPGEYAVRTALAGFGQPDIRPVMVPASRVVELTIRCPLATVETSVTVESPKTPPTSEVNRSTTIGGELVEIAPLAGDSFQAVLPLVPGVIRRDDGKISLSGGRPEQSGLQVAGASVTDPVTGGFGIELPIDAVESIEVIAGPFSAEYGRFTAGVTRLETRQGSNEWKYSVTNFVPIPRVRDRTIKGISRFGPRFLASGPLVRDRLFLTESVQYELRKTKIPSLPDGENDRRLDRVSSFTRFDAIPDENHHLIGSFSFFPRRQRFVNLDTFNREPVSPDLKEHGFQIDVAEDAALGSRLLESNVTVRRYDVDVEPRGVLPMQLQLAEHAGNYFHQENRESWSVQWIESLTWTLSGPLGEHHMKVGADLLWSSFTGTTADRPVEIVRADGSVSEVIRPIGPTEQDEQSTDASFFVQDRWRVNNRLLVDGGARLDRDGVIESLNVAPRVGATVTLDESGATVVRGGYGLFFQRSPLNVAAFESYGSRGIQRYTSTGSPIGPARLVANRSTIEDTPRASVTSVELNRRFGNAWLGKVGYLYRRGSHEFLVDPLGTPATALVLSTTGRSKYAELEGTVGYHGREGLEMFVSYVRSRSHADYNDYGRFFGNIREPVIRANEYARSGIDVPNRLIFRGTVPVFTKWQLVPLLEMRTGFPYSALNQDQEFVGVRNGAGRFPKLVSLDLGINRVIRVKHRRLRVGLRTYHLVGTVSPRDVDNNVDSPLFRTFYNGLEHKFGVTFQILP
jgi:hypothetical protein